MKQGFHPPKSSPTNTKWLRAPANAQLHSFRCGRLPRIKHHILVGGFNSRTKICTLCGFNHQVKVVIKLFRNHHLEFDSAAREA